MSQIVINLDATEPNFTTSIDIDSNTYILKFLWNTRGNYWTGGIFKSDNTPIVSSQKLCVGYPLFARFVSTDLPEGLFWVIDTVGNGLTRENLGTDVVLIYED
jgi:hypothetical protein